MTTESTKKEIAIPESWASSYTKDDIKRVEEIIGWANLNNHSLAWLANLAGIGKGTPGRLLAGSYPSPVTKQLKQILDAIFHWENRAEANPDGFVPTSVYKLAVHTCDEARIRQAPMVLPGKVGVGKTTAIKKYAADNPRNTILVEGDPDMRPKHFLRDVAKQLKLSIPNIISVHDIFVEVLEALKGTTYLIIIDEAEKMQLCLERARRLSDKAHIGVVLVGTENLDYVMQKFGQEGGHFNQMRSRAGLYTPVITGIDESDLDMLLAQGFKGAEIDDEMRKRFKFYSQGSARMLVQNLIYNIKRYGINKGLVFNHKLIDSIAVSTLDLRRYHPRAKGAL